MLTLERPADVPSEAVADMVAGLIASGEDPFSFLAERYYSAPNGFWREVLRMNPDPWQAEANRALAHGHTRLAIRSGHGVGKSTWAAAAMCWFANTRAPMKIGVTAPSAPQLFDALWAEAKVVWGRLPQAWRDLWDVQDARIELKAARDECFITARTARADKPEALQGLHAKHLMLLVDEASAVDEAVFESAGGSMSTAGAITMLTGNPTRSTGFFWRCFHLERDRWWTKRVSCLDSPRAAPEFITEIAERYGETSNAYRIRVLGEFPQSEDDTLIAADLVESAMRRDVEPDFSVPEIWGLDVARFGSDASVLIKRRGTRITEPPRRWNQVDTMQLAGAVKAEYDLLPIAARPQLIAVDVIGIGSGVVDRLTEQNMPVLGINVGESPSIQQRFVRLRDELWVRVREWLESRRVSLPYEDRLRSDLCAPRVSYLSDGRMQVESKQQLRSRGYPSPDCFVAGTMIATPGGQRPIEALVIGDLVCTPFGPTPVVAAWETQTDRLTTAIFSNGATLRGTGKHKVFCWGAGIRRLDALSLTDRVEPQSEWRFAAWRALNLLRIEARDSEFRALVDTISRAGRTSPSAFCIAVCGRTFMALFRRIARSTTAMVIGVTTPSTIWNCALPASISACTSCGSWPGRERWNASFFCSQKPELLPLRGIGPRRAGPGIERMASLAGKTGNAQRNRCFASAAESVSPPDDTKPQDTVRAPVAKAWRFAVTSPILAYARGAVRRLWRTATAKRHIVPVSVQPESVRPTSVFNVTLERHNAYYANGILVFNCGDALALTFCPPGMALQLGLGNLMNTKTPIRRVIAGME